MTRKISSWVMRGVRELRELGPYAPYALAAVLPGGSIIALAVWLYRRSRGSSASPRRLSRALAAIVALACLTVLPGCVSSAGLTPVAHARNAAELAASRTLSREPSSSASWPAEDWWVSFGDPQLDRLISEGLEGSPTLEEAQARTRAALAAAEGANAARFPQIEASASSFRELFPDHSLYPPPYAGRWNTLNDLEAGLSFEIDFWGKNRAAYLAALGEARAAALDARAARVALAASIAHLYVALAHDYLELDVARTLLSEREHIYSLTRERNAAGIDSRLELTQAESALPDARERITQLEERIALTRDALAALLGEGPDRGRAIERPVLRAAGELELPSRLPAELLGRRPDILALRWRIEAARHGIERAKAEFYPDVNLSALVGLQSLGTGAFAVAANREVGAGPAITLPIFDAGRRRAELSARDAEYDIAVDAYDQALADALREVVDQIVSIRSVEAQNAEQREGLATAQVAYDLALMRYQEGIGNYLQVLSTHEQLLAQRTLEVDLRTRAWDASIELARSLGGGFVPVKTSEPPGKAEVLSEPRISGEAHE